MKQCTKCKVFLSKDFFRKERNSCSICDKNRKKESNRKLKLEVISHYSKGTLSCVCCGENIIEFLTIDHINNDGAKSRKEDPSQSKIYSWIKRNNYPENMFRVLCFNCNCSHGFHGYCPHTCGSKFKKDIV